MDLRDIRHDVDRRVEIQCLTRRFHTVPLHAPAPHDDSLLGARSIGVGAVVGVEPLTGDIWRAQVTYVSDRLVGLRGWTMVDGQFRERDTVTFLIGAGDRLVSAKAHVLAASGSLMRIVRRDGSDETKRRIAPRLRVDLTATVRLQTPQTDTLRFNADVIDLSAAGCALRSATPLPVGAPVTVDTTLSQISTALPGVVVRTWTTATPPVPHAGIQFDPMPPPTAQLVSRFLVDQLRTG